MRKTTSKSDLEFIRKYCLGGTYPASDERCPYAKAKLRGADIDTFAVTDGMFLCRYPDKKIPTHEARLISELKQCPNPERREEIDSLKARKL